MRGPRRQPSRSQCSRPAVPSWGTAPSWLPPTRVTETPDRPRAASQASRRAWPVLPGRSGRWKKSPSTTSRSHPWVSRSMRRRARSSASPPLGTAKPWRWKKLAFSRWTSATKRVRSHRTAFSGRSRRVASPKVRWTAVVVLAMAALQLSEHARDALGGRFRAVAGVYSRGPEWEGEGGEACQALALPGLTA